LLPLTPVLALRAGGARSFGSYPWFDAPSVGGEATLRGFDLGRFTGEGAVFAGAELRARLFRFSLGLPGEAGFLAATDVGRVWLDGEAANRWHSSVAGGIWVSVIDRAATLSATLADGERTMVYVRGGFAY
jgi:hemolysin activation/secretion protein